MPGSAFGFRPPPPALLLLKLDVAIQDLPGYHQQEQLAALHAIFPCSNALRSHVGVERVLL